MWYVCYVYSFCLSYITYVLVIFYMLKVLFNFNVFSLNCSLFRWWLFFVTCLFLSYVQLVILEICVSVCYICIIIYWCYLCKNKMIHVWFSYERGLILFFVRCLLCGTLGTIYLLSLHFILSYGWKWYDWWDVYIFSWLWFSMWE